MTTIQVVNQGEEVTCSVAGCGRGGKIVRGWCLMHYQRWQTTGDPTQLAYKTGPDHPGWKGGRKRHCEGYVEVLAPGHHRAGRKGYVFEHILVAEEKYGVRVTWPEYTVHHKNGVRDDNRPENLELRLGQHGAGASIEDLADFLATHHRQALIAALERER